MFARVTVIEGDPARFDEVKEFITSQAAPRSRGLLAEQDLERRFQVHAQIGELLAERQPPEQL
jgi:hypothetical protein